MGVAIARSLLDQIRAEAAASPNREICGLMFGRPDEIAAVMPTDNVSSAPADSFEIDPQMLFRAIRDERAGRAALIGHYHSHPGGSAVPSERDRQAAEPDRYWLIVGSDGATDGADVLLWRAERGEEGLVRFRPVALVIR
jgi:proteasome lid subunit RPN8/RPN11